MSVRRIKRNDEIREARVAPSTRTAVFWAEGKTHVRIKRFTQRSSYIGYPGVSVPVEEIPDLIEILQEAHRDLLKIDQSRVKELRTRTGASMAACEEFLVKASGDLDKAQELLNMKGMA